MSFSDVPRQRLGELVAQRLRRDIVRGVFAPGSRLTEEQLSASYDVSRVPVREALRVLESEGFVVIAPYKGTTVAPLTMQDARKIFDVRIALETLGAQRAAELLTPERGELLTQLLARGAKAVAEERVELLPDLNTAFHLAIVEGSDNDQLMALMRLIAHKVEWAYAIGIIARAKEAWQEHEGIVTAILARDGELAGTLMGRHIRTAENAFAEQLHQTRT